MSVSLQLWMFLALISTLAVFCLQFGVSGLYHKSIALIPSKTIRGSQATIIASVFVFAGVFTGSYVLFGVYSMLRMYLMH
ncbi:MAG: hypothetical protein JST84_25685 [Acidobacteria bacterium]|nr:hypothetical protein [Acidobacteriota bacterium]